MHQPSMEWPFSLFSFHSRAGQGTGPKTGFNDKLVTYSTIDHYQGAQSIDAIVFKYLQRFSEAPVL